MAQSSRIVDFNRLPATTRRRLVDSFAGRSQPRPLLAVNDSSASPVVGWTLLILGGLALGAAAAIIGFGGSYSYRQSPTAIAIYALAVFAMVSAVLALVRRWRAREALPFAPGRYLLPCDVVVAKGRTLEILPLSSLTEIMPTHRYYNGSYTGSSLELRFENGTTQYFWIATREQTEATLAQLRNAREAVRQAVAARDLETIASLDPLFEARLDDAWNEMAATKTPAPAPATGPIVRNPVPQLARHLLIAAGIAAVVSPPTWLVRNTISDEMAFQSAQSWGSARDYRAYLEGGGRHASVVRSEFLPRVELAEAKRAGTVRALREVMESYPDSEVSREARAAIRELFAQSLVSYRERAVVDPAKLALVEQLLTFQEAHGAPPVLVTFHRPATDSLASIDHALAAAGRTKRAAIAPIAPHFDESHSIGRESLIVTELERAFADVARGDVLSFRRDDPPAGAAGLNATLEIHYSVKPSGAVYQSDKSKRLFIGVRIAFAVVVRVPGATAPLSFAFEVSPPAHFNVTSRADPSSGGKDDDSNDDTVYEEMARRAFDELHAELQQAFFGRDLRTHSARAQTSPASG